MGELVDFPSNGTTAQGHLALPSGGTRGAQPTVAFLRDKLGA